MDSHARLTTDRAVRYMTQLGKHWSHKVPVLLGEADCEIDLPIGRCVMRADGEGLDVTATAETPEGLTKLEDVIASHLARFAFREGEMTLAWTRQSDFSPRYAGGVALASAASEPSRGGQVAAAANAGGE